MTAVSEGTAQITVSSVDGSVSAVCNVTVDKAPEHEHTMRLFTSKDPTCTQAGHADYYLCTDCGCRFGDENGAVPYTQTSDYTLPATHQRLFLVSQGDYHVQRCKCGAELTETKEKHTDSDGDGICEVCNLSTSFGDFKDPVTVPKPVEKQDTSPDWITPTIICGAVVVGMVLFVVLRRRRRGY